MAVTDGNRMAVDVQLDVLCRRDPSHILGIAVMHLAPHPRAGRIVVGNGLTFDEHEVARGDCTAHDCESVGRGTDQQISARRIESRMQELLTAGRYTGKLQA